MFQFTTDNQLYTADIGVYRTVRQFVGGNAEYGPTRTECIIFKGNNQMVIHSIGVVEGEGSTKTKVAFSNALVNGGWSDREGWDIAWDAFEKARKVQ